MACLDAGWNESKFGTSAYMAQPAVATMTRHAINAAASDRGVGVASDFQVAWNRQPMTYVPRGMPSADLLQPPATTEAWRSLDELVFRSIQSSLIMIITCRSKDRFELGHDVSVKPRTQVSRWGYASVHVTCQSLLFDTMHTPMDARRWLWYLVRSMYRVGKS
jgi:hypothetical protein